MGKLSTSTKSAILIIAFVLFSWRHSEALYEIGMFAAKKNAELSIHCSR
ncbi:hypothetical protein [Xanthomonas sp. XNM01]|nr:hypothetical protein [Xanthomonas sp. XNM01]